MDPYRVRVGIDVGMNEHQVCLKHGEQTTTWALSHRHEPFYALQSRLLEASGGQMDTVLVGLEGHNGHLRPLDQYLLEWGCDVVNLDARKLNAFRETFGAPCKTDVKDALLIVHLLEQGDQLFQDGTPPYHEVIPKEASRRKLKKLSRYQQTLIEEETRLLNRLNKWIREISPELLDVSKIKRTRMLRMLRRYPNVRGLTRVTKKGLRSIDGIGPQTAEAFYTALQDLDYDAEMVGVYETMIEQTASRILELRCQIKALDERLESLGQTIEDVGHLRSLPGCGVKLASRLMGEIGRIERFDSHNPLAVYLGIACVDYQSGDTDYARPIFPANTIAKDAMMQLAQLMVREDAESRKYYKKKRSEGNGHRDAVRRTARQIVKIIFRLLVEQRDYVPYSKREEEEKAA